MRCRRSDACIATKAGIAPTSTPNTDGSNRSAVLSVQIGSGPAISTGCLGKWFSIRRQATTKVPGSREVGSVRCRCQAGWWGSRRSRPGMDAAQPPSRAALARRQENKNLRVLGTSPRTGHHRLTQIIPRRSYGSDTGPEEPPVPLGGHTVALLVIESHGLFQRCCGLLPAAR